MKVEIAESLFADFSNSSMLSTASRLAWEERHRVSVVEDGSSSFKNWLDQHPAAVSEEWELINDLAIRLEALEPATSSVVITDVSVSNWTLKTPHVSLADGVALLRAPFEVLVENARNDRAFLMSMATIEQRRRLAELEDKNWLRFSGAGGIGEMKMLLETFAYQRSQTRFVTWVAHDSDALQPNSPSMEALEVRNLCNGRAIGHHMLTRRAIENYLPMASLEAWARRQPGERLALYRAYDRMSEAQRSHFNMKGGFKGDAARGSEMGALYDDLSLKRRAALAGGFGNRIAELYREEGGVLDEHADVSRGEVQLAVGDLLGLLN